MRMRRMMMSLTNSEHSQVTTKEASIQYTGYSIQNRRRNGKGEVGWDGLRRAQGEASRLRSARAEACSAR